MDMISYSVYELYQGLWSRFGKGYQTYSPIGNSIFEKNWDLLIVLDGCRVDLLEGLEDEYGMLSNGSEFESLGSSTYEWMNKNFLKNPGELNDLAYITGNPFSNKLLHESDFRILEEVWKDSWDDEIGTIRAERITDKAISIGRDSNVEDMIVHYMQPHFPSIPHPELGSNIEKNDFEGQWDSVWKKLQMGKIEEHTVWQAYLANLRYVLDSVKLLINNVNFEKVIITSDHGNLFGEYHLYGHPSYVPIRELKRVPWYETSANDSGNYTPHSSKTEDETLEENEVDKRLKNLGYLQS